jgi:hypothetical protein
MQYSTCPRCNMVLAPGAQLCPNCQLNLLQYAYQMQQPVHHHMPANVETETKQEKKYRVLLTIISLVVMSELLTYYIPSLLDDWFHFGLTSVLRPLSWITTIAWAGMPLVIGIILPKRNSIRVLLIIFASIFAVWHLGHFAYYEWFYSYDDFNYTNF